MHSELCCKIHKNLVFSFLWIRYNHQYWIGAERKNKSHLLEWIQDGRPANINDPNDGISDDLRESNDYKCVRLWYKKYNGHDKMWGYYDMGCSSAKYGFLCEGGV